MFNLNLPKLFHKLNQSCLPVYIADMFQDFSREHDYNTRQSLVLNNVFHLPATAKNLFASIFLSVYITLAYPYLNPLLSRLYIANVKNVWSTDTWLNGPLARYVKYRVAHAP